MKKWLFNPFVYVAGWQALGFGLLLMLLTLILSYLSQTHFDGAIDAHFGFPSKLSIYVFEQLNAWLSATIIFFAAGSILSKSKIRIIDVAGTLAFARFPMLFVALIGFVPSLHQFPSANNIAVIAITGLIVALLSIWMVTLMYFAFTISCNLKGSKAIVGFVVSVIVAEIFSKIIIHQVYQHI